MKLILVLIFSLITTLANAKNIHSKPYIKSLLIENARNSSYVTPALALAVAKIESNYQSDAVSNKGAIGVMQIMPLTALMQFGIEKSKLFDPKINIKIGVKFLDHLIKKYKGNISIALSHYNGGSAVMKNGNARVLPYTRDYVSRVLVRSRHYKNTLNEQVLADAQRGLEQRAFTVQTSAKRAKSNRQAVITKHINHVDRWLSVVNELAPRSR